MVSPEDKKWTVKKRKNKNTCQSSSGAHWWTNPKSMWYKHAGDIIPPKKEHWFSFGGIMLKETSSLKKENPVPSHLD